MIEQLVPILAIVISVGSFLISAFSYRQKAEINYVASLESRIKELERRMLECELSKVELAKKNEELIKENTDLFKRIVEEGVIKKMRK